MSTNTLSYDEAALKEDLQNWWNEEVSATGDPFAEPKGPTGTIFDALPNLDSLSALKGLLTVEEHVPFEVPVQVIRRGGYYSFDDLAGDLLPKLRRLAAEHAEAAMSKEPAIQP